MLGQDSSYIARTAHWRGVAHWCRQKQITHSIYVNFKQTKIEKTYWKRYTYIGNVIINVSNTFFLF